MIALLSAVSFGGALGEIRLLDSILTKRYVNFTAEIGPHGHGVPFFWEVVAGLVILCMYLAYYVVAVRQREAHQRIEAQQEVRKFQLPRLGR